MNSFLRVIALIKKSILFFSSVQNQNKAFAQCTNTQSSSQIEEYRNRIIYTTICARTAVPDFKSRRFRAPISADSGDRLLGVGSTAETKFKMGGGYRDECYVLCVEDSRPPDRPWQISTRLYRGQHGNHPSRSRYQKRQAL